MPPSEAAFYPLRAADSSPLRAVDSSPLKAADSSPLRADFRVDGFEEDLRVKRMDPRRFENRGTTVECRDKKD